ncbi:hypothetical protein [Nocardioides deserti]|uniref:Uncharacterized protein n=1 Tax=Nocardioides deserti TaxID=1588644 RepID=A0ABR6U8Q6_9ACTN|nr:hypothetical protein [Nocardioides deserti]MBC2960831.1 hypothetical protein [Nocardioides deserti]GGO77501.1 hypothetical protein GCM10012276_32740 [Nocardioides deserti]
MPLARPLAALALLVATPVGLGAVASPVEALSCVGRGQVVAGATVLFTGRVVDTDDGALEVEVAEVRRGEPPVDPDSGTVRLVVEAEEYGVWPREGDELADGYRSDRTWLFAPYEQDGAWRVNPCNAWVVSGRGSAWERSGTATGAPFDAPAVLAGSAVAVVAVGGIAVWLVRRRRTPRG